MEELGRPSDDEDDAEAQQELHRLRATDELEQLIQQEGDDEHVEPVSPAEALQKEVRVAQQVAHAATPAPSSA